MKTLILIVPFIFFLLQPGYSQQQDSLDNERLAKMINLSEVVVRTDINVPKFIDRVKNDTTFYKAFKNLHVLGFTSLNDIRIINKKGKQVAGMQSKTRQNRADGCRTMETISETTQGDFYNDEKNYNYYTAELYAGIFLTRGKICTENNIVAGNSFTAKARTRNRGSECWPVRSALRSHSGRAVLRHACAYDTKNRCSGVRPSITCRCLPLSAFCSAS